MYRSSVFNVPNRRSVTKTASSIFEMSDFALLSVSYQAPLLNDKRHRDYIFDTCGVQEGD